MDKETYLTVTRAMSNSIRNSTYKSPKQLHLILKLSRERGGLKHLPMARRAAKQRQATWGSPDPSRAGSIARQQIHATLGCLRDPEGL